MSDVNQSTLSIISRCFSTQNWFLIFPASIGNILRNPPLYLDGRVKHHNKGRSDSDYLDVSMVFRTASMTSSFDIFSLMETL